MENTHKLPELPYAMNALEPYISKETLEFHYGEHHAGYIRNLNNLVQNTEYKSMSLEQLITNTTGRIFNNAAQAWNHAFYWRCLKPGGAKPKDELIDGINKAFGSLDIFETEFTTTAISHFGSGWAWLVLDENGKLVITSTHDADTPIRHHHVPLLTCDVWEHAYYIDYRNKRADYLKNFWQIVNWEFVSEQYQQASRRKAA